MSKAFTKESDGNDGEVEEANALPVHAKNYVTPAGLAALQEEFRKLLYEERPKVVEIVSWAAGLTADSCASNPVRRCRSYPRVEL